MQSEFTGILPEHRAWQEAAWQVQAKHPSEAKPSRVRGCAHARLRQQPSVHVASALPKLKLSECAPLSRTKWTQLHTFLHVPHLDALANAT